MPQVKWSENWDGVAPPSLPPGWAAQPGFQTSSAQSRSGAQSLRFFAPGSGPLLYWPGTTDQFGGNARVSADFLFTGVALECSWWAALRLSPDLQSYYAAYLGPPGSLTDGLSLFRSVGGAGRQVNVTVGQGQFALNTWYTLQLTALGSSLAASVRRLSDGFYYNPGPGWVPYRVAALQAVDTAVTGAGFAGLLASQSAQENNPLYSDNFLFEDLSPDPGILLKRKRRPLPAVPVKKKRKRGWQWFSPVLKPPPPTQYRWFQFNFDSVCQYAQVCSALPPDPASIVGLIRLNVQGGPEGTMLRPGAMYLVSEPAALASWPGGQWVVRLHVTRCDAPPGDWFWDGLNICRVSSTCASLATVASVTGLGLDITSPAVYEVRVTGAAQPATDPADCFYLAYGFTPGSGGGGVVKIQLDAEIIPPFNYVIGVDPSVPDRLGLVGSAGLRKPKIARKRRPPLAYLFTPQPPATGPADASLFRRRRRLVLEERLGWKRSARPNGKFRKHDVVVVPLQSPKPPWPAALFPRPRKRRPSRPTPRYRRQPRWPPLAPLFIGADKAMIASALVEENLQAATLIAESLPGAARVLEALTAGASIILGDVLRKQPPTTR